MKIGIPKEVHEGERRVATTPDVAAQLQKLGFDVAIESGAGDAANFADAVYAAKGVKIVGDARALWADADIVIKVRGPERHPELGVDELELLRKGQVLISFLWPAQNPAMLETLKAKGVTALAMDSIPRISRAQKMDALSSMANIAGYRAVVEAAQHFGLFFTGQITAAGKVPPAKVLVIGAGVAGLAAIGAAKSMGAIVRSFDTRPEVKEQVESMNAEFLLLDFDEEGAGGGGYAKVMSEEFIAAEMALFAEQAKEVDIIITTALIPGKPAPKLITAEMVESMKPGSVVVDLAAEQGGNCECTVAGKAQISHGVTVIGYTDMPSRMPSVASDLFGTNLANFLDELGNADKFNVDHENEIVRGALVTEAGEVLWPAPAPPPKAVVAKPAPKPEPVKSEPAAAETSRRPANKKGAASVLLSLVAIALAGGWAYLRFAMDGEAVSPSTARMLQHLTVFVLACFVGWQIIWNVTAALHTPLMSVTNAISGIIIVGGLFQGGESSLTTPVIIGSIAILFATINVFGGFFVTQRMLQMFRR